MPVAPCRRLAAEQLAGVDGLAGAVERRTRAGTPGARDATCRSGSGRPRASRCCWRPGCRRRSRRRGGRVVAEDAVGAGLVLGAGEHHERLARRAPRRRCRRCRPGRRISGSSALQRDEDRAPLLTVWSTPWSKNWPKNVNSELYGGERPTSVVTFGMNSVLCDGTQSAGRRRPADGRRVRVGRARERRPGCPACGPGSRPRRPPPGSSRSGRRSGC